MFEAGSGGVGSTKSALCYLKRNNIEREQAKNVIQIQPVPVVLLWKMQ